MRGILTSILTVLTFSGLQAQPHTTAPKLVVTLTIDQLRTDYLENFSSLYGERGFKRILREGRVFRNTEYNFNKIDRASAIAAIYTGTTPSVNGIMSAQWMDVAGHRPVNCVDDPAFMGNYTDEYSSPANLLTSTITDELKISTANKALVYSVSPFRDAAVFAAGHAGNCALWINENTGKWASSTYYTDFPLWVGQYNERQSLALRIGDLTWVPVHPIEKYAFLPEWRNTPFRYKFDDEKRDRFRKLITSPFVNDEVNTLAEDLIEKSNLGKDNIPDMLSLTYYAGNYDHKTVLESPMEIQDTYARLDRSIAALLDMLDKKIGLQHVLVCITSTGYTDTEASDGKIYRIPGGDFHLNRCAALLNMYLMATYGQGQYVEAYYDQQIYLNRKLIEQKQLPLSDVQEKAADFLIQFSGVNEVYSAHRLLLGAWTPEVHKIRNGFHRKRSGDLLINVLPGWTVINESNPVENKVVRNSHIPSPLIFFGNNIKPEIIRTPVTVDCIAPTLAHSMRIRAPNASTGTPLTNLW